MFFQTSYILRRPQHFAKSSPYFWLALHRTKVRGRFCKILWPSQNIWTLPKILEKRKWFNILLFRVLWIYNFDWESLFWPWPHDSVTYLLKCIHYWSFKFHQKWHNTIDKCNKSFNIIISNRPKVTILIIHGRFPMLLKVN